MLLSSLEFAKHCAMPVVLHVLTTKGKGYEAAINFPEKFHGLGPYDPLTGATPPAKPGAPPAYHEVFGQTMVKLCQKDNSVVGITAAMPTGTGLKALEKAMPERLLRRGHRRGTRRPVCRGHGDDGLSPGLRHLLDLPATRLRLHRPRRGPAGFAGDLLHGPRGPLRATTARRTTACSTSPTCAACRTSSPWRRRTKTNWRT